MSGAGVSADFLADAAVALAASTHAEGALAVVYAGTAKMLLVQAREHLERLERGVAARETELLRLSKLARGSP